MIGVTACVQQIGLYPYHVSGDKYLRLSALQLGCQWSFLLLGDLTEIEDLLVNSTAVA